MFVKIKDFLNCQGIKYLAPAKAGEDAERMLVYREMGQEARKEFTHLVSDFQKIFPHLKQERTSQWMNQAQRLRPHFWAYLQREGEVTEPMLALRLYGSPSDFGVSLEVSFIERKKDERTLDKQAKVLEVPVVEGIYYLVYSDGESQKMEATEENRQVLKEKIAYQEVRKVLVKADVPVTANSSEEEIVKALLKSYDKILPFYLATRKSDNP